MFNEIDPLLYPDKPTEECGVFGIYAPGMNVAWLTYYGIFALQHRGQESAGIAVANGGSIELHKGMGLVPEVFACNCLDKFSGFAAIGHVRYGGSAGASQPLNAQPLVFRYAKGMLGLAHSGNLTNITDLSRRLASTGSVFQSTTNGEVLVNLIARYNANSIEEALMKCMIDVKGAYALLIMTEDTLYAARDPHGFRPLCLGRLGEGYVVASESCALTTVGATFIRDLAPGEILRIDRHGVNSTQALQAPRPAYCIFEYIYFARPDSTMDGYNVNKVRREMGRQLAREYLVDADIVIPVPDSGTTAARGYAEEAGIAFEEGLVKNRYIGRTFIQPTQKMRELGVHIKLNPIREVLAGKRVVMVDDSIVRGTTSQKLVTLLRQAGAKEVHLAVSSPPVLRSCYYGIDTSDEKELIAANMSQDEICQCIEADSLHYLSLEGLLQIFTPKEECFCTACFNGNYPVEVPTNNNKG